MLMDAVNLPKFKTRLKAGNGGNEGEIVADTRPRVNAERAEAAIAPLPHRTSLQSGVPA
ncbi:MAG TPA: hypothetical protein VGC77_04380 [Rhodopseudomonas sp.]|uniref:hypothetical protein n=1 Tax=Rhodopseudomonas sp. TaxID=1078 RepID=UPI002ED9B19A